MKSYDNYVLQIFKTGSLTRAAESLGISQPALSLGLNKLEKELGFKIFDRRTMPLRLTAEGQIYYDFIQRIKILNEDFDFRIATLRKGYNDKVVVGGPEAYVGGIVTMAVKRLLDLYPHFSVGVKSASISQLIDLASNREIDCFISTTDNLPSNFVQLPIKKEKLYLCIPRKNPLNIRLEAYEIRTRNTADLIDFSCLDGQEFIFLEEWQPLQKTLRAFLKQYAVEPVNRTVVNQVSALLNLSIASECLCIASEDALICNGNADQFCLYLLPETISGRLIYVAYDKELYLSQATQELIKILTKAGGVTK